MRVPEAWRLSKLHPKAVLVRYTDTGYKVLVDHKVVISRNVQFINNIDTYVRFKESMDEDDSEPEKNNEEESTNQGNTEEVVQQEIEESNEDQEETEEETRVMRPRRQKTVPKKFDDYVVYVNYCNALTPETYEEAIRSEDSRKWQEAMKKELKSLEENKTWTLVNIPEDKKIVEVKWIFKIKTNGEFEARVVARGFQQQNQENEEIRC